MRETDCEGVLVHGLKAGKTGESATHIIACFVWQCLLCGSAVACRFTHTRRANMHMHICFLCCLSVKSECFKKPALPNVTSACWVTWHKWCQTASLQFLWGWEKFVGRGEACSFGFQIRFSWELKIRSVIFLWQDGNWFKTLLLIKPFKQKVCGPQQRGCDHSSVKYVKQKKTLLFHWICSLMLGSLTQLRRHDTRSRRGKKGWLLGRQR